MSITETSSKNSITPIADSNLNNGKVITSTDTPNTGVDPNASSTALNQVNYDLKAVSILQNTYFFNEKEAQQVSAFAKTVAETNQGISVNIKPGFLTKLKSLCAKILTFFGNESKAVQLREDGIAVFNRTKNIFLMPENKEFALGFIETNKNNANVLKGFGKVLGLKEGEATPEQLEAFINVNCFNKIETYGGKTGKIVFLKNTLNKCTNPELSLENRQILLDSFVKILNRYVEVPSELKTPEEEFYCALLRRRLICVKDTINRCINSQGVKKENALKELDDVQRNLDVHIRLFQNITEGKNLSMNNLKIHNSSGGLTACDVDILGHLVKYAEENKLYDILIDPKLLESCPDVKTFLEQEVLPMTKEEVQNGLERNLKQPSKSKETVFSHENQIFKDLERNFTLTLQIDGKKFEIEVPKTDREEGIIDGQIAFSALNDTIESLTEDQKEKIQEFCKNFSTQGVLALPHPRIGGYGRIDGSGTHLVVDISQESIHVCVITGGEEPVESPYAVNFCSIQTHISTPVCKFEFDYHPEDGSASDVKLSEYEGQTVKIVSGLTDQGESITF